MCVFYRLLFCSFSIHDVLPQLIPLLTYTLRKQLSYAFQMEKLKIGKNTFTLSWIVASLIEGMNLKLDLQGHEGNGQKSAAVSYSDALVLFHHSRGKLICKRAQKKKI